MDEASAASLGAFFAGRSDARAIFERLQVAVEACAIETGETPGMRVSTSQVALRRRRNAVIAWTPDRALGAGRGAPLVLSLSFPEADPSPRWKTIVRISARRYTHHLELWSVEDVDAEVRGWIEQAWAAAG